MHVSSRLARSTGEFQESWGYPEEPCLKGRENKVIRHGNKCYYMLSDLTSSPTHFCCFIRQALVDENRNIFNII